MAREFSLGEAILRSEDSPQLPDLWLESLLHRYLDGQARAVLAQCNKAALSLLLSEWPEAALTIRVQAASGEPPARLLCRMHRVQQQIAQRGSKGTQLHVVEQGDTQAGEAWWLVTFASLARSTTIASLSLQLSHMPPDLFHFIGPALPALTTLTLRSPDGQASMIELPAPSALPALRGLSLLGRPAPHGQAVMWDSVGLYLPQLTSLVIGEHYTTLELTTQVPMLAALFTPGHTSHTLTHIELPGQMTPHLAALLQQQAPSLQVVTVTCISSSTAGTADVGPGCLWRKVRCRQRTGFAAQIWAWLPLPATGKLTISSPNGSPSLTIEITLPLTDKVADKLMQLHFKGGYAYQISAGSLEPHEQPAALQAALPPLTSNKSVGTTPVLHGFTMSAELAAVIAAAAGPDGAWSKPALLALTWPADAAVATPLPQLGYVDLAGTLGGETLAQLLACVRRAGDLYVRSVSLRTGTLGGAEWPFGMAKVKQAMTLAELLSHAQFLGGGVVWRLGRVNLSVDKQKVDSGEVQRLTEQLSSVRLHSLDSFHLERDTSSAASTEEARQLRAGLAALRALPCAPQRVYVKGFQATDDVVRELRGLPECAAVILRLGSCCSVTAKPPSFWPLARLAWLIPRSYTRWAIKSAQLKPAELEAFLLSAPADRTSAQPLSVVVYDRDKIWVDSIASTMTRMDTYPHVTVTHGV